MADADPWLQRLVRELQILAGSPELPAERLLNEHVLARLIPEKRIAAEDCVARTLLIESILAT
ncbi:MAG: hypothetical protein H0U13_16520 [Gemmatimonadaceae bacterium]|nr:hypothetical protein [Gemmatimonadaceae bacterium]